MKILPSSIALTAAFAISNSPGSARASEYLGAAQNKNSYELHFYVVAADDGATATPPPMKKIGSAVFTRSVKDDEVRKVLTLNLKIHDTVATIVIDTTSKKDGTPIKKTFVQNGKEGGTVNAFFTAAGVDVYKPATAGATPDKLSFPLPAGATMTDPTEAWFSQTKPTIGAKATYYNFNVQALTWEETTAVYIEDVNKVIGDKTYPSHHLRLSAGSGSLDEFVDDHGDPVFIDQGNLQIQRSEK